MTPWTSCIHAAFWRLSVAATISRRLSPSEKRQSYFAPLKPSVRQLANSRFFALEIHERDLGSLRITTVSLAISRRSTPKDGGHGTFDQSTGGSSANAPFASGWMPRSAGTVATSSILSGTTFGKRYASNDN